MVLSNVGVRLDVNKPIIKQAVVQSAPTSEAMIKPLHLLEKDAIEQAIALCDGNVPKAAALLDVSPSTIYRKRQAWEDELV